MARTGEGALLTIVFAKSLLKRLCEYSRVCVEKTTTHTDLSVVPQEKSLQPEGYSSVCLRSQTVNQTPGLKQS